MDMLVEDGSMVVRARMGHLFIRELFGEAGLGCGQGSALHLVDQMAADRMAGMIASLLLPDVRLVHSAALALLPRFA
jgi:hypothetical protein